jgi:catechol 2,3-dioxygenase-like lactoylglutathione lyase family enzyme
MTTDFQVTTDKAPVEDIAMKLEVLIVPVSDVDRSKAFYGQLGWRLDDDASPLAGLRIVQFTPPGSAASVSFGQGITMANPGSGEGTLVVSEIEAARADVVGRGIEATAIWHGPPFPLKARQPGPDPDRNSYQSFFSFNDPDGNLWIVQEVTHRLPGRVAAGDTSFGSVEELADALQRAEVAHRRHEKRNGHGLKAGLVERMEDDQWPTWYAAYIIAEQTGADLPA